MDLLGVNSPGYFRDVIYFRVAMNPDYDKHNFLVPLISLFLLSVQSNLY